MKKAIHRISNWAVSKLVPRVDAGACFPPDCCAINYKLNCQGYCTSYSTFCQLP